MGEIQQKISKLKLEEIPQKLNNHKEVENKFGNIQEEIVNLRQGLIVEKLSELGESLEVRNEECVETRLREFGSRLHKFHAFKDCNKQSLPEQNFKFLCG
jgi:hypothetical protein